MNEEPMCKVMVVFVVAGKEIRYPSRQYSIKPQSEAEAICIAENAQRGCGQVYYKAVPCEAIGIVTETA